MREVRLLELMMQLVISKFAGQRRLGPTPVPASTHSLRVGLALLAYDFPLEVVLGGFGHDLIEDTKTTAAMLLKLFGKRVSEIIETCTLDPRVTERSAEDALYDKVVKAAESGDTAPLAIKCVDSNDNLKTNHQLGRGWQIEALWRGERWYRAGEKFFPENPLFLQDFKITLERERKRIRQ